MNSSEAILKYINALQFTTYLEEKIGLISVKSYLAKGDGSTDDTTEILEALEYVTDNNLKSLFFPHGVYVVNPALISAADFTGIFVWGDNSSFSGISHPINQIGTNISLVTTLLGLTDTPSTYSGQTGKFVRVNAGESAIEFVTAYTATDIAAILADYYTATAADVEFATKAELSAAVFGGVPPGGLTTAMMADEQKRGNANGVASLVSGNVPLTQLGNVPTSNLANKIALGGLIY